LLHPDPLYRLSVEEVMKKKFVRKWTTKLNNLKRKNMNLSTNHRMSSRVTQMTASQEEDSSSLVADSSYEGEGAAYSDY
jgi:hypothetical protein